MDGEGSPRPETSGSGRETQGGDTLKTSRREGKRETRLQRVGFGPWEEWSEDGEVPL